MLLSERSLYLLFTPSLCAHDPWETLDAALVAGVDLVQWRAADSSRDDFDRCHDLCRHAGVPLIVNNDVMLALRGHATGAHIGQQDMIAHAARRLLDSKLLGISTHDLDQIDAAIAAGADYLGFGPCYATATKGYDTGQDTAMIAAACEAVDSVPLFAIGGITAKNLPPLRALGVDRIAVSNAILGSDDPGQATAELRRLL